MAFACLTVITRHDVVCAFVLWVGTNCVDLRSRSVTLHKLYLLDMTRWLVKF